MEVRGKHLCLGCMRQLNEGGTCSYCGMVQRDYHPNPRCLIPGTLLVDRYMLGRVLGEGSFGITYIGWDTILEIPVAVKEYFPSNYVSRDVLRGNDTCIYVYEKKKTIDYKKQLRRFYKESQVLGRFHNLDSIVSVRDFFYANKTAYIVMDYIEGISLKEYIKKEGHLSGKDMLSLMKPVLADMAKVHKMGIIHRDISPDNLILSKQGRLVVIDFGSARIKNTDWTKTITVMFKRGFSPEEQYHSKGKQGAGTDIYALCATMYYMLTGNVPEESVSRMLKDSLVSLTDIKRIRLSPEQKDAIMKGMEVDYKKRFQSLEELYQALFGGGQKQNFKWQIRLQAAVLFVVIVTIIYGFLNIETHRPMIQASKGTVTTTAKPVSAVSTTADTEVLIMPELKGVSRDSVTGYLKNLPEVTFLLEWKEKESKEDQKGKVIEQSLAAGRHLTRGLQYSLVLYVGKGEKKMLEATTEKKKQSIPKSNKTSSPIKKKPREEIDFDGSIE